MMFKTHRASLLIHPNLCELTSGTCRIDLNVASSRGEKHDACDKTCLYRDTISEDEIELAILLCVRQLNES